MACAEMGDEIVGLSRPQAFREPQKQIVGKESPSGATMGGYCLDLETCEGKDIHLPFATYF